MPIKIFAAPGDHRNDFTSVEKQVNAWIAQTDPRVLAIQSMVNAMPAQQTLGDFMLTVVVHFEDKSAR